MKQVTINLYSFDELSEKAKQKALENMAYSNVDYDWWESIYDDAKEIGCKINGFDIDHGSFCDLHFVDSASEIADKIMSSHGEICKTYKTAQQFLKDRDALVEKYSDGERKDVVAEENEYDFDNECDDLEDEFRKSLSEDYCIMLQREYEYLTSEEAIIETIQSNEYTFTEDGKLRNS